MIPTHAKIEKIKSGFSHSLFILGMWIFMAFLNSCSEEKDINLFSAEGIQFDASILGEEHLSTRASLYDISSEFYTCNFFMHVEGKNNSDEEKNSTGTYWIPSGSSGIIVPVDNDKSINWFSKKKEHNFWGWTLPFDASYTPSEEDLTDGIKVEFKDTYINEFNYSNNTFKAGSWANGVILEQLLGAQAGPKIYDENGMYLSINFRHMVSKIIIRSFNVVNNNSGVGNSAQKGEITIFGLPKEATFYPCPKNGDGTPRYPYVAMPENWDYNPNVGETFVITNFEKNLKWEGSPDWGSRNYPFTPRDCWYICPEVDLKELSFQIRIFEYDTSANEWKLSERYGNNGAYYGDFSAIEITRNNSDYDNPGGGDETILHAGEYLILNINLQQNGNPGVQGTITAWAPPVDREANSHTQQGLYTIDDINNFIDTMTKEDDLGKDNFEKMYGSLRTTADDYPKEEYPDYNAIYGKEFTVFEIFDDIGTFDNTNQSYGSSRYKVSDLLTGDDCIIDGNGHTINCNATSYSDTSYPMQIGHVRNVYLRKFYRTTGANSAYYESIVYIDKMGNVWIVDPVTYQHTPTEYNVNDPEKNPVTINIYNGKVS